MRVVVCALAAVVATVALGYGESLSFYISNHDQSPAHRVIHPIVGKTNFVYDAKGALEKIRGEAIAFLVKDSKDVTIRNLRLDWERHCMTEARIVGFENGATKVTIDRSLFPFAIVDGKIAMTGPGWTNGVWLAKLVNGRTGEHVADVGDISYRGEAEVRPDGSVALLHDFSKYGVGAKAGDVVVLRPRMRPCPAIVAMDSSDVRLEDVVVHDAYGMAFVAQRCENVSWRGSAGAEARTSGVFPREGCVASAHADASHFSNVKGHVAVENCWFEGMMDDAINVHSTCLAIVGIVSNRFMRCRYMHPQSIGFDVFGPGETLRFIRGRTLENGPEVMVVAVERLSPEEVVLALADAVPEGFGVGDAVENADWQCSVSFTGNVVRNNRARGSLFTTSGRVVVASNRFERCTGAAVLFAGDASKWYETGSCRDVAVCGNLFSNCCTAAKWHGYSKGILSFCPTIDDIGLQKKFYHRNILVEGNVFYTFDVPLLYALSVEDLLWRNNRVFRNDDYQGWGEPPFVVDHCRNVAFAVDDTWAKYVPEFNSKDEELYTNTVPNSEAESFLRENAPSFTCPDKDIERTYHFRWWTYRKHIKKLSEGGRVVTEFLPPVPWAGPENTINCAMGHHLREGRWLADASIAWEYLTFMLEKGRVNGPRAYSCWPAVSLMDWLDVTVPVKPLK